MPRNVNGTYTLVAGNPVVTGTVIDSNWANTTMPDLGSEMTDSLSRSGKGGMLAPMRGVNGSVSVPAYAFTDFVQSGMYMSGAGDLRYAVTGVDKLRLTAGDTRPQYWSVTGGVWVNVADADDVSGLQAEVDATTANVATNTGNIATNTANIAVNTGNIATNTADIATNTADIATNTAGVATNALAITLVGDIASIPSRNNVINQDPLSQGTAARAGMSSTIYTGNGTTQSITTGVDMATGDFGGLVWVKGRSGATDHQLFDTVRGSGEILISNATNAEATGADTLTSFDSTGFSLSSSGNINTNTATYVAWSFQTTEKTTGTTNRNKPYTCHYNADLGFSIVGFEGDGVDGHEIPTFLPKKSELSIFKGRDGGATSWIVQSPHIGSSVGGDYLTLNTTSAILNSANLNTIFSESTIILDTQASTNGSTNNIINYNFTSIEGSTKVGRYIGTGATGNYVDCGFKVGWVMVKQLDAVGGWLIDDASRGDSFLLANSGQAEAASDTFDYVDDGFVLKGASVNTLNGQYIFVAFAESTPFDGTKTLTNYDYATADDVLTINEGTLMSFAEGFNAIGQANTQELVGAGTTLTLGTGKENKTLYIYKDKASTYGSTEFRPLEGTSRAQADKFGVVSPLDAATRTTDKHFGYESATGVALASGEASGNFAWYAFNKGAATAANDWVSASGVSGWLQYKFAEPRVLKSWRIRETTAVTRTPLRFTIQGSDDGFTWTAIDSTYTASDYVGNGASLWGDIQDTSANTTAYLYHRINVTSVNGGTDIGILDLEFNTITPSDYYNVLDGQVYNNAGTVIDRVYLGKVITGASGEILNFENYTPAKTKAVDGEYQGDVTVHNEIKNRGICTAWAIVNETTNPPNTIDSHNIKGVVDIGGTSIKYIVEDGIDVRSASIPNSVEVASITDNSFTITSAGIARRSIAIFGGKEIL